MLTRAGNEFPRPVVQYLEMAFCPQCGTAVGDRDPYCSKCGARQPGVHSAYSAAQPPPIPGAGEFMGGLSNRSAALLCYIPLIGWIAAIVVLASDHFRREVQTRFHAFQGLYLFVAWLLVEWVVSPVLIVADHGYGVSGYRLVRGALQLAIFAAWIVMMIKVSQDENYHLPIVGDLAERSVSEQRG
jgi:uncharacterized membrane protein